MAIGDVTAGSIAGQVHFSGLGNGTDFDTLITKLVQVEKSRSNIYTKWKQSWLDKNTAFKDLNAQMLTLRTTLQGMNTIGTFLKKAATSTNTTAMAVTAGGEAETSSHTFSVHQLAQNKVMITGTGKPTLTSNVNTLGTAASLVYTYKGVRVSNAVPASATLTDIVNIINVNPDNKGVRASTLYDGTNYYLQIRGLDTGEASSLVISNATTLPGFGSAAFVTSQANQDAKLKIDGWPASNAYISRPTNTISDVIAGLTLSVKSSGAGTISVATDADSVVQNVQNFVDQVNLVRQKIISLTKYDATTKQGSILTGNYGLQMVSSIMNNITAAQGIGFNAQTDAYSSLSSLGLSTDANQGSSTEGLILLDVAKFKAALASNANAVGQLFSANLTGGTDSADVTYASYITGITKGGSYGLQYTVAGGKITAATMNGHPVSFSSNSAYITGMSGYDEAGLVVRVNNLTDGSYSHTVSLKQGKIPELSDELKDLTNDTNGPLNILQKNYTTISDNIQKKIDDESARVSRMETRLRMKFAKLDALLGTYNQQTTSLTQQIASMNKS